MNLKKVWKRIPGRGFLSRGATYLFFSFLNQGISFLLLPIYSRCLTQEDYGIYALFLIVVMVSDSFLTFCVHDAVPNVYFDRRFDIRTYVSTFIFFTFTLLALQELLLFFVLRLCVDGELRWFFLLAPWNAMGKILLALVAWMWQLREQAFSFGLFQSFCVIARLVLNLTSVLLLRLEWRGLLISETVYYIGASAAAMLILRRSGWIARVFDWHCLRWGLKFGLGTLPGNLAIMLNDSVGRVFLADKFPLSAVGVYSMGQKLGSVTGIYTSSLLNVYRPWLFKVLSGGVRDGTRTKILRTQILACLSIMLFSVCVGTGVQFLSALILGRKFLDSLPYFWLSLISFTLTGMFSLPALLIYYARRTWTLSCLTVAAVVLNIGLTWLFLRAFGMIGAGYAPALAWGIVLLTTVPVTVWVWRWNIAKQEKSR